MRNESHGPRPMPSEKQFPERTKIALSDIGPKLLKLHVCDARTSYDGVIDDAPNLIGYSGIRLVLQWEDASNCVDWGRI